MGASSAHWAEPLKIIRFRKAVRTQKPVLRGGGEGDDPAVLLDHDHRVGFVEPRRDFSGRPRPGLESG